MSSRWKVHRARSLFGGIHDSGYWGVVKPGDGGFHQTFRTHAEALTYADRKARTASVVLPPVGQVTKVHGTTIITTTTGQVIHGYPRAGHRLQEVFVPHERAEQFALALLAHVKKGAA